MDKHKRPEHSVYGFCEGERRPPKKDELGDEISDQIRDM
jgi:hypothetical protein